MPSGAGPAAREARRGERTRLTCHFKATAAIDQQVLAQVDSMREQLRHALRQVPTKWTPDLSKALTAGAAIRNTWEYYKVPRTVGGPVWSPQR